MNVVRIDSHPAAPAQPLGPDPATAAERAGRLLRESRAAALEHLVLLQASLTAARDLSLAVSDGGEAYAVGLRELSAQLAEDLFQRGKALELLTQRERAGLLAH